LRAAGLDVGSRTIGLVVVNGNGVVLERIVDTTHEPLARCSQLLESVEYDSLIATGYGRYLVEGNFSSRSITEIKALARGVGALISNAGTVVDIGGQDTKVVSVNSGGVLKFDMNDRCAAGTGKFLEIMAKALGFDIEDLGKEALKATAPVKINSMCTVFAESEVTSLIARGEATQNIAYGLHMAISERTMSLINRVGIRQNVVFTGGVAKNVCMQKILRGRIGTEIIIPPKPQLVAAYGAALHARDINK
jgi:predicted CoA-substrate-specific enzyme activase